MQSLPTEGDLASAKGPEAARESLRRLLAWRPAVIYLVLQTYTFLLFWPTFGAHFVTEDALWLYLANIESTLQSFVDDWGYLEYYRPITRVSFLLSSWISGDAYWGWKLTDLMIHGANSFFVCMIAARISGKRWFGLALGFLFVISPLGFSIPTWLSARTVGLGFFFLSLGVLLHDKAFVDGRRSTPSGSLLFLSCLSLLLGLMSHEGSAYGMVLAGGFLFLRYLQGEVAFKSLFLSAGVLLVTAALYYAVRRYALGESMGLRLAVANPPLSEGWWDVVFRPFSREWTKLRFIGLVGFLVPLLLLNWRFGLKLLAVGVAFYFISIGLFAVNGLAPRFFYGAQIVWLLPAAGLVAVLIDRRVLALRLLGGLALLAFFAFLNLRAHLIALEVKDAADVSVKIGETLAESFDKDDDRILLLHPQIVRKGRGLIQVAEPAYTVNQFFDQGWKLTITSHGFLPTVEDGPLGSGMSAIVLWSQVRDRRPVDCIDLETLSPLFSAGMPLDDYLDLLSPCDPQFALFDFETLAYHEVSRNEWLEAAKQERRDVFLKPENAKFNDWVFRFY